MDVMALLQLMQEKSASDLYISPGAPVNVKIEGKSLPVNHIPITVPVVKKIAYSLMNEHQIRSFEAEMEMDLAISVTDIGRFRINIFRQRGEVAMVVRYIKEDIPSVDELHLPLLLNELVMEPRGLILIVGTTGSGKSTTLASMIDHRNTKVCGHILTIEDPIEYLHHHKKSIVNQREVGMDTKSYQSALKRAMREAPDVILIGEIRDRETMEQAILYAETGHLCLSTLHATNADQALERIVNFFPEYAHHDLFMDLSLNLRAIISQRLVIGIDGKRRPAVEVLLSSSYVKELIQKGEIDNIKGAMKQSVDVGMQTFDQSLYKLYKARKISLQEALRNADSRTDLSLRIRLSEKGEVEIPEDLAVTEEILSPSSR